MWATLGPVLETTSLVMLPGWPLGHSDHRYATMLVLDRLSKDTPVMFYGELPTSTPAQRAREVHDPRPGDPVVAARPR